jgi:hypothetical protein
VDAYITAIRKKHQNKGTHAKDKKNYFLIYTLNLSPCKHLNSTKHFKGNHYVNGFKIKHNTITMIAIINL